VLVADNRYDAARQTIGAQLATTSPRLEVPEWQRSYSWDRSQVETFWQDLRAFSDQYPDKTILENERRDAGVLVHIHNSESEVSADNVMHLRHR
jgi:uncharacterized protein with ParB-like and HNH nuclease domain